MNKQLSNARDIGFVVIGRNEGARLKIGLQAIQKLCPSAPTVYVDSGSTDNSVKYSRSLSVSVVELDLSIPFTAARARNAGFKALMEYDENIKFVQFMDGDCEVATGWIEAAASILETKPNIGIVCGRRREKFPGRSIYNFLCDIEWNTPVGEADYCGGDFMIRTSLFNNIGGFNSALIAGEEPELCLRIKKTGMKIVRIDNEMTLHDANIMHLSQWYRRSKRGGHAYANINHLHGKGPEKYFRRQLINVCVWGGCVPLAFILFLFISPHVSIVILTLYSLFVLKTILRRIKNGDSFKVAVAYGILIYTGKIAEMMGVYEYWKNQLLAKEHRLIEYK